MHPLRAILAAAVALICLAAASSAGAVTLQPVGSFASPIYVTSDPGNPDRLFVVERKGRIQQVQNGVVTTFADISAAVGCPVSATPCAGERGLLSIALAPDFDSSGRLYVDYANSATGAIHVAELRVSGNTAPSSTLRDVLVIPHSEESNHNGGQLQFGPEGLLFISTGDGGGSNDTHHNAQDPTKLLGKILRIDPRQSGVLPYTVPPGNPFPSAAAPANTIWSLGLRNPFRFSFDRLTGDLAIGDVGQAAREEVDFAAAPGLGAGNNYGWSCREGFIEGAEPEPLCSPEPPGGFVDPVFDYAHTDPGVGVAACAIIGGYVVRDPGLTSLYGRYLYGDLCTGQLRSIDLAEAPGGDRSEGLTVNELNSFGEDSCGRLYAVAGSGQVSRLVGTAPTVCPSPAAPTSPPSSGRRGSPLAPSYVGIRAVARKVKHGSRASITAWVSPCAGRKGEAVRLYRGVETVAVRRLDRACTVRFHPRITRRIQFRATVGEDSSHLPGTSRKLRILVEHRKRARS